MIRGKMDTRQVWVDDVELLPGPSQAVFNHSPDGFCWGYCGSGPSQLALALMLHFTEDEELARALYIPFKFKIVSCLNADFELDTDEIRQWIEKEKAEGQRG